MTTHHPDLSTLMSYSAGSLPDAVATVVAAHLSVCSRCRQHVQEAEQVGIRLLEELEPATLSAHAKDDILALLDKTERAAADSREEQNIPNDSDVPPLLRPVLGYYLDDLHWKYMAPGLKQFILPAFGSNLRLLKIAPGTCMPSHGHTGSELTMVLRGSYTDELGRFCAGDVADLDPDVQHQPVADTDEHCICLIATDAPLRFNGLVPRLLQPFFQI
ncbi:ChrR family anti-sigma-E factor [Endozoicomonas sp. 4G]|uniref:ChrR family anti-sigma-E factor n=1 Tax=Endozoicomonas sp. 4G TaxID=2872754 RepID=UPI002078B885|nr:ChrR family anti-sigma-E factor [Endozoicomonas sp. 4G]